MGQRWKCSHQQSYGKPELLLGVNSIGIGTVGTELEMWTLGNGGATAPPDAAPAPSCCVHVELAAAMPLPGLCPAGALSAGGCLISRHDCSGCSLGSARLRMAQLNPSSCCPLFQGAAAPSAQPEDTQGLCWMQSPVQGHARVQAWCYAAPPTLGVPGISIINLKIVFCQLKVYLFKCITNVHGHFCST